MRKRIYIWVILGINLFVLTSQAVAQQEQWLQYHSGREVSLIGDGMNLQELKLSTEKPSGVELPQFKGENQLFAKWSTPMVKSGHLWIALDQTHKRGLYDSLYIDSNGNDHLKDEIPVTSYRIDQYNAYFGSVKVVFEVEDGPVTYHLNLRFYSYDDDRRLYASSGGWYEGDITVSGAKKHCVLLDYNANGTFDDKSLNSTECDRIRISKQGGQDTRFVGNYIELDGVLYEPEIARDGAYIKLTKAKNVKFGNVRPPESITEFSVSGENGLFTFKPEKGSCSLPVGKYSINDWEIARKDDKGTKWKLCSSGFSKKFFFDIIEDEDIKLSIGEPIISTIEAENRSGTYSFSHNLKGQLDEHIELTRNDTQPRAPKLLIKNKDGSYDRTFSFEYG